MKPLGDFSKISPAIKKIFRVLKAGWNFSKILDFLNFSAIKSKIYQSASSWKPFFSHIGKITYDFPYIPLTATKLKKMRDRSYSRAISNMNSDSGSEEIVRNGTNRSVFHKKGMSFILRIHMIHVTYQMNFEFYFDPNPKIKITEGTSKINLPKIRRGMLTHSRLPTPSGWRPILDALGFTNGGYIQNQPSDENSWCVKQHPTHIWPWPILDAQDFTNLSTINFYFRKNKILGFANQAMKNSKLTSPKFDQSQVLPVP